MQTQDCLRIEVLHLAREMTRRTFVEIPANVMTESTTNASAGAQPRLQTVLDLRVLSWELGGHARPYINPDFQLIATAEARLIDHANGKVLYTYANSYAGKRRMKFTEWAAAAGQPLRTEFRTTSQEIARDMIEQIFLRTKPLVSRKRN